MQPKFPSSDCILPQVIAEIERAKGNKYGIVILEYSGYGPTHTALRNILRGYKRKVYVSKFDDDGSLEFAAAAHRNKFGLSTVIVVGVNRGWCVKDTVRGLLDHGKVKSIQVVENATWGNNPSFELQSLKTLSGERVKFV